MKALLKSGLCLVLTWATAQEHENSGFRIQRKNVAVADDQYENIGFVGAKEANSSTETGYGYIEAGEKPDRQAFLAQHEGIAAALAECLDGVEALHGIDSSGNQPAVAATQAGTSAEFQPGVLRSMTAEHRALFPEGH